MGISEAWEDLRTRAHERWDGQELLVLLWSPTQSTNDIIAWNEDYDYQLDRKEVSDIINSDSSFEEKRNKILQMCIKYLDLKWIIGWSNMVKEWVSYLGSIFWTQLDRKSLQWRIKTSIIVKLVRGFNGGLKTE